MPNLVLALQPKDVNKDVLSLKPLAIVTDQVSLLAQNGTNTALIVKLLETADRAPTASLIRAMIKTAVGC